VIQNRLPISNSAGAEKQISNSPFALLTKDSQPRQHTLPLSKITVGAETKLYSAEEIAGT
jgi:hypothetical protein